MADCAHKHLVRIAVEGMMLSTAGFLYFCSKCRQEFQAAISNTVEAEAMRERIASVPAIVNYEPPVPDHAAAIAAAERQFSAHGLNFSDWAKMLREGQVSEHSWRQNASSIGFQPGDVDQLIAAVFATSEEPATE